MLNSRDCIISLEYERSFVISISGASVTTQIAAALGSSAWAMSSISGARGKDRQARKSNAVLHDLDMYMERLYDDDVESKQDGAIRILHLAMHAMHTEQLVENEALMVCKALFSL